MRRVGFIKYVAGFFDAEGSITIAKFNTHTNPRYQLNVNMANKHVLILKRIRDNFGEVGYLRDRTLDQEVSSLVFLANQARIFLDFISPYLILKKNEANLAISFQNSLVRTGGKTLANDELNRREAIKKEMTRLHSERNIYLHSIDPNELLPYIAGIIDGDGYIGILHGNTLTINLTNENHEFLEFLKNTFGVGFISKRPDGCHWIISSSYAKRLLELLFPYLILKKREAELAIKFQNSINPNNTKRLTKTQIKTREIMIDKLRNYHLKKGPRFVTIIGV